MVGKLLPMNSEYKQNPSNCSDAGKAHLYVYEYVSTYSVAYTQTGSVPNATSKFSGWAENMETRQTLRTTFLTNRKSSRIY